MLQGSMLIQSQSKQGFETSWLLLLLLLLPMADYAPTAKARVAFNDHVDEIDPDFGIFG